MSSVAMCSAKPPNLEHRAASKEAEHARDDADTPGQRLRAPMTWRMIEAASRICIAA